MEGAVGFLPRVNILCAIPGLVRLLCLIEDGLRQMWRGVPKSHGFESRSHLGNLFDLVETEAGDPYTPAGLTGNQPLRFEAPKSLAYRNMARTELFGDVVLAQFRAGLDLTGNDPVGERFADSRCDGV